MKTIKIELTEEEASTTLINTLECDRQWDKFISEFENEGCREAAINHIRNGEEVIKKIEKELKR